MKVIFNYATRQFESMEPTMRERFALGGGVIQGEKVGGRENFAAQFAIQVIAPGMVPAIASLLGVTATTQAINTYLQNNPEAIDTVKKALELSGKITGVLPFGTKPGEQPEIEEELKELSKPKGFPGKAPDMPKSEGTKIPEPKKQDIPVNIPPKVEPLPGLPIDEEAKSPQILNFKGTRGKTFEDLPKDIELKPITSGEVFVKTGGTKKRAAPLTEDGEALLENFEKVIEYYNSNNIPTPGLRDIFNIAGGNDVKKFREEKSGKKITAPIYDNLVSSPGKSNERFKEVKAKFIPLEEKINNYVGNVMLDPDADWRQFINPERHLAEKFGVSTSVISRIKTDGKLPNYTNNKKLFDKLSRTTFTNKFKDGTKYQTIEDIILRSQIRPPSKTLGFSKNTFDKVILESALRYNKRIQNSQENIEPEIRFIDDPTNMDYKDVKFVYKGKTFQLDPTEDELTDKEMTKNALPESARKINELAISFEEGKKKYGNIFPEVFKAFENLEKFKETKVDGKLLDYLVKKKKFDTDPRKTEDKDFIMKRTSVEVDHKEGVLKPFDVRVIDRDINRKAGKISRDYMEGKITLEERNAAFENLGYNKDYENFDDFIEERKQFATGPSEIEKIENMINEKFGFGTMTTADEAPEPDSSILSRLFERFNKENMAQGGRVGFANGSPDPMEEMATLKQALAAVRSSEVTDQFLYDTSPVGKLEKNLLGKDGDRTLAQSFNTQFLDPRAYPYYAQKLVRGAANIPEFILSTPKAGLAFIKDLKQNAGITKEGVEEILEILDPSITRDILNGQFGDLLGISDKAIQASEEKRSGPQRTTGDILQLAGELPGPATPFFLIGYAPKLLRQLRDLGASGTAIDKINKEIENKVAQQGVDQTRRDIVLSIGAGGAVAFLKYLGLDTLFKGAPKVVEKAAPKIVTQGGTPKYFFDFVSLIKSKGDDITEKAATVERQKVYDYNGYVLTEDISTGKITINKNTEGMSTFTRADGESEAYDTLVKEQIEYSPPETIINDKGKSVDVPDSYDEMTLGRSEDAELGLDSIDEILELLAKDGKSYTVKELEKMGLDSTALGNYKPKKAGGGIVKLAGEDSGPPPKSGPTPHGLPYVAKNVRPIKERK